MAPVTFGKRQTLAITQNAALQVLKASSTNVFVPLTIGGGIRDFTDSTGATYSALQVAGEYFRSGADKVSIGSDAVEVALEFRQSGEKPGTSAIETISEHYGRQAVVVSIDPKRVWVSDDAAAACSHALVDSKQRGPNGESKCWWQCTVKVCVCSLFLLQVFPTTKRLPCVTSCPRGFGFVG